MSEIVWQDLCMNRFFSKPFKLETLQNNHQIELFSRGAAHNNELEPHANANFDVNLTTKLVAHSAQIDQNVILVCAVD